MKNIFPLLLLIAASMFAGCSSSSTLQKSVWNDGKTNVDGNVDEWRNALVPVSNQPFSYAVRNDADYLYVTMVTGDPATQQAITGRGLIVWFEVEDQPKWGIRYPIGLATNRIPGNRPERGTGGQRDPEAQRQRFMESLNDIDFVSEDINSFERVPVTTLTAVKAAIDYNSLEFAYELRIPLQSSAEVYYALGTSAPGSVKVSFQTPQINREALGGPAGEDGLQSGGRAGAGRAGGGRTGAGEPPGGGRGVNGEGPGAGRRGFGAAVYVDFSVSVELVGK